MAKDNNKKQQNKAPEKGTERVASGKKGSLLIPFLPSILGSFLAVCIGFAGVYLILMNQGGQQIQANYAKAQAHGYLNSISSQALQLQELLTNMASTRRMRTALSANDKLALVAIETQLKSELPGASTVKIFLKGKSRKNNRTIPPISFAQLDMITRAEKNEVTYPEVYPYKHSYYVSITAPIKLDNKIAGTLYVSLDLMALTDHLPAVNAEWGFLEFTQQFGNANALVFYSSGNNAAKQQPFQQVSGLISHWQARFYPSKDINIPAKNSTILFSLGGGAILLAFLFSLLSFWLVKKALSQNAMLLTSQFNALTAHEKTTNAFTLDIFHSLGQTIERLFKEYDTTLRHQALKQQDLNNQHQTSEGSYDPTYQKDDVLDFDINEDDSTLLDGDTPSEPLADPLGFDNTPDAMMDIEILDMADSNEAAPISTPREVPQEIFRAYDIRGVAGENLNDDITQSIGLAIGSEALAKGQTAIVIARDGRLSSASLAEALANGLTASGINVIDLGMMPTPVLYFATNTLNTQSGVMVTGSHNPPNYNGFKIVIAGETLANERIQALRQRIEAGQFNQGQGSYETRDITQEYTDRILNDVVLAKPMNIVIDCGNGVAGMLATDILNNLGCSVSTLYGDVDGNFPNHHPDPSKPENLTNLIQAVKEQGAEIGIAFDGDGDRLGVVTASGKIIWPDRLLMLYARDLLSRNPGSDVIYDVKCSRDVAELVSDLGGRAIMSATGHSLMKAKMAETGAVVGGELSGHIFFNDRWYGFDDAIYSASRLLEILSMEPVDVESVFAELPEKLSTPEIAISISEDKKFAIMDRLSERGQFSNGNMVTLDGIRVDYPDGWGLVRASNTTPNLTVRFEGKSEEALARIKDTFRQQIQAVDPSINVDF
ncbi:MAG: phosphomannomutase [Gammaproteobacteria bacterium]|nr:MAG: phosphomannomutase [Gammaproteobacteria bacterium]